jgi:hypothetical protein
MPPRNAMARPRRRAGSSLGQRGCDPVPMRSDLAVQELSPDVGLDATRVHLRPEVRVGIDVDECEGHADAPPPNALPPVVECLVMVAHDPSWHAGGT